MSPCRVVGDTKTHLPLFQRCHLFFHSLRKYGDTKRAERKTLRPGGDRCPQGSQVAGDRSGGTRQTTSQWMYRCHRCSKGNVRTMHESVTVPAPDGKLQGQRVRTRQVREAKERHYESEREARRGPREARERPESGQRPEKGTRAERGAKPYPQERASQRLVRERDERREQRPTRRGERQKEGSERTHGRTGPQNLRKDSKRLTETRRTRVSSRVRQRQRRQSAAYCELARGREAGRLSGCNRLRIRRSTQRHVGCLAPCSSSAPRGSAHGWACRNNATLCAAHAELRWQCGCGCVVRATAAVAQKTQIWRSEAIL